MEEAEGRTLGDPGPGAQGPGPGNAGGTQAGAPARGESAPPGSVEERGRSHKVLPFLENPFRSGVALDAVPTKERRREAPVRGRWPWFLTEPTR